MKILILTPEEEKKASECLAILQEAQGLVDAAAQALCSVRGFANEWSALSEPYDTVKKHWHKVNSRFKAIKHGKIKIDHEEPMKRCGTKQIAQNNDVLARLASFAKLERKDTDEIGWIALAYSCSRTKADTMIVRAREYEAAVKESESPNTTFERNP